MENTKGIITFPSVYMHISPSLTSEASDELLYGTSLYIQEKKGDWYRCRTSYGYSGFVHRRSISDCSFTENLTPFIVTAPFADILAEPCFKYRPVLTLPKGSIVFSERKYVRGQRFSEILHRGRRCYIPLASVEPYIKRSEITPSESTVIRKKICDDALMYLGAPYRWSGKSPSGIDCSGLCFMSYFLNGLPLWRDAYADKRYVHEIPENTAKQGDLIYFKGHAAIYIGDGEYVHSSASAGCVTVSSLNKGSIIYRADLADKLICFARSNLL